MTKDSVSSHYIKLGAIILITEIKDLRSENYYINIYVKDITLYLTKLFNLMKSLQDKSNQSRIVNQN
jgi:hypothetical protein